MRFWKRNVVVPSLLAALAVLVYSAMSVEAGKQREPLGWADLEGDRSAIANVTLSGSMADGYHRTTFSARGGDVSSKTKVYATPRRARPLPYILIGEKFGDEKIEIYGPMPYEIRWSDGFRGASAQVSPRLAGSGTEYTNQLEYGIAKIGDKYYFAVPTTRNYTGTNAIYELDFRKIDESYRGSSRQLASIPLDKNADPSSGGIEVLGLEAVGDTLALVTAEDGKLVVSGYDSGSGMLLGRAAIDDFALAGRPEASGRSEAYYEGYRAFADEKQEMLILRFVGSTADRSVRNTVWTVSLKPGEMRLVDKTELSKAQGMVAPDSFKFDGDRIRYLDGRLYVARALSESEDASAIAMSVARPMCLFLEAYEGGALVYRGELKSAMNDDAFKLQDPSLRSVGYGPEENRNYYDLRIE